MVVVWYNDDTVCNLNFGKDVRKIMLENKLGITDATELARTQETIVITAKKDYNNAEQNYEVE